jgi:pyruvate/2-oxoglutarate/acetoin dehydrogenase E1 component/TPP-dependent pyruvate/acetoin dehydrogenase alpha subunit
MQNDTSPTLYDLSYDKFKQQVLTDYEIALKSRELSLLGRKEVLTGKAKFGIFGDGKELAQIAWSKFFKPGDFRSGYYRDQTFMMAADLVTPEAFFAQLYADADASNEPMSGGRQMSSHFATPFVDEKGNFKHLSQLKNVSADMAPTAGQMPRALGLAQASKLFRENEALKGFDTLSINGDEICCVTIGDASTSEGHFWETINAAGVMQVPLVVLVWDNGYGISVPKKYQTTKGSISKALSGMQQTDSTNGLDIYRVKGWDYAGLCETMENAFEKTRSTHIPCLIHVEEITQPQGHSTSGSHERYKSNERLEWEKEWDCIKKMKEWIIENAIASEEEIQTIELAAKESIKDAKNLAWSNYLTPIQKEVQQAIELLKQLQTNNAPNSEPIQNAINNLESLKEPLRRDIAKTVRSIILHQKWNQIEDLKSFSKNYIATKTNIYASKLYNEGEKSALKVKLTPAQFDVQANPINGFEILNKYFDALFETNPKVVAFGEDVGQIGDVNQGFSGLQEKYGTNRIFDTGIREATIMGQGIGLALRGLRPIAEIQYLDYLLYGMQTLSDDVCTLHYRSNGIQSCPLIVRTRGHRLEGIWHSGSPMGMIINALRGMYVCVPRNMTQAVGMYNTLLASNDPGLVVECLNGYRLKENLPTNLLDFKIALGKVEILQEGTDVTVVSYGSTLRIIQEAMQTLNKLGVSIELIDVQTLLPFDIEKDIVKSLQKTNRIIFIDEDVPGGAAAYMYNQVIEKQDGYKHLDVAARTLTANAHRPPYGSDGDYFSKPNAEDVIEVILDMMAE